MTKSFSTLFLIAALSSFEAAAHDYSEIQLPVEGLTVDLGVSGAYRSESVVKSEVPWVIPGTLMGGEAFPSGKGLALDEAFLVPSFRREQTYGYLKLGRHIGSEELELDHILVGHALRPNLAVELGQMAAIFSPFNGQHAMDTSFSSRRLVYDAIWGGQYNDQGVRVKLHMGGFDAGLELWKGNRFPAQQRDTDRSAYDAYLRYAYSHDTTFFQAGAFGYRASASRRDDSRYSAGHSHGARIAVDPSYFDGDVAVYGLTLIAGHAFGAVTLGLQGELSQMSQDGKLWDLTHEAEFENETLGLWGEVSASVAKETLSFRSERLKIKNDIYGSAALVLGQKLGLIAAENDPYRHSVSYEHHFTDVIRSRIEWSKDFTSGDKKDVLTIGAVWIDTLLSLNPPKD